MYSTPRFPQKVLENARDPSGDDDGSKRIKFQRCANAAPVAKFGTGTRDQRMKLAMATCAIDEVKVGARSFFLARPVSAQPFRLRSLFTCLFSL